MTHERWHQITEIYHAARERDPAGRDAFVAEACRGDLTLRREVEAMLNGLDDAGQFGESPLFTSPSSLEPGPSVGVTAWAPGARLGPYEIMAAIGAGGMGEVYRAHDTRLSRDVAIKTLPPAFADDPERLARFRREARMLASLNHPNIAAIYGLEKSGDVDHLVLELVEGEILSGPIPVDKAVDYCTPGCRGAGSRAWQGHHPPRFEASQRQSHARRPREGTGFRVGESCLGHGREPGLFAIEDGYWTRDRGWTHRRLASVHEPGAGARESRGRADRHLGFRLPAVRAAHREAGVSGRGFVQHDRSGAGARAGLDSFARRDSNEHP